jgi:hypothetical protein
VHLGDTVRYYKKGQESGIPVFVLLAFLPQLAAHGVPKRHAGDLSVGIHPEDLDR